jgi:hypothetical protein
MYIERIIIIYTVDNKMKNLFDGKIKSETIRWDEEVNPNLAYCLSEEKWPRYRIIKSRSHVYEKSRQAFSFIHMAIKIPANDLS